MHDRWADCLSRDFFALAKTSSAPKYAAGDLFGLAIKVMRRSFADIIAHEESPLNGICFVGAKLKYKPLQVKNMGACNANAKAMVWVS